MNKRDDMNVIGKRNFGSPDIQHPDRDNPVFSVSNSAHRNCYSYLSYRAEANLELVPRLLHKSQSSLGRKYINTFIGLLCNVDSNLEDSDNLESDDLEEMEAVLSLAGMNFGGSFSRQSITAIWIAAALRCAIPLDDIRSMVAAVPEEYSFLSSVKPKELSDERKERILHTVAASITNESP